MAESTKDERVIFVGVDPESLPHLLTAIDSRIDQVRLFRGALVSTTTSQRMAKHLVHLNQIREKILRSLGTIEGEEEEDGTGG